MKPSSLASNNVGVPEFLAGGGELGQLIRDHNWGETPLGPVETWPQSLRTCVRIMLTSRQPIWIGWGKELIKLYNDPYKAIVGGKHPWALGKPASVVWQDIWRDIGPMLKQVMEDDQGTFVESQLLIMERNGYAEETYYTFSYTPIPGDDDTTAGMICANSDDTDRIISERQLKTLTQLGKYLTDADTVEKVMEQTIITLNENPHDFPFSLFYNVVNDTAILYESSAIEYPSDFAPQEIKIKEQTPLSIIINTALTSKKFQIIDDLKDQFDNMPEGAWGKQPEKALVLPLFNSVAKDTYSFLIVGCNPYRLLNESYTAFFNLVIDQVSTSLTNVYSWEEERKRAEALAEIDRAKTTFFSNISHEFRTPLTLLLGPIEETLHNPENITDTKARMEVAYRNALRLQRMVNTLLEFSRIEAGKMDGQFTQVDIAKFTADLASTFRDAIEKSGMQLIIDLGEIKEAVYVDMEMWEKIVLNLISNAFKYSKEGIIRIELQQNGAEVNLSVSDTGIGIPERELTKIFDRFHRIENMEGRSKEGTGIGLAMVKELAQFHNGNISVQSEVGKGSTFTVSIPVGKDHIPEHKIIKTSNNSFLSVHSNSFLQEASRWISSGSEQVVDIDSIDKNSIGSPADKKRYSVLLADDNADMREYVERLLTRYFSVITANDGADAFNKSIKHRPDLILSDVMMPKLDGFGLLQKIRSYPETKNIPIILLSARAGEEAKIEGLDAGADDYLVKPFSAKELVARVDANIKIAKNRLAAENNLKNIIQQSPIAMTVLKGADLVIELTNEKALELWGKRYEEVINLPTFKAFPELLEQGFHEILHGVYSTGKPFIANERPVALIRNGKKETLYINFIYEPLYNTDGITEGIVGVAIDITELVKSRKLIQKAEERLLLAIESADLGTYDINLQTNKMNTSDRFNEIWGVDKNVSRKEFVDLIHPDDKAIRQKAHEESIITGRLEYEARVPRSDKSIHWVRVKGKVLYDDDNTPITLIGIVQDITEQKLFSDSLTKLVKERTHELERSNDDLQQFAHVASHDLKEPVRKIKTFSNRLRDEYENFVPPAGLVFIEKIQHSADRMFDMIEGVLNYSKLNSLNEDWQTINLNETFNQIISDLELFIQQKKAVIKVSPLPVIEGIPILIYQLFYNIINNSLKFSKADEPCTISVTSDDPDGDKRFARVVVADNGIGFNNEYSEKIFQTFTRLNSKDKYEGTGLGLSLCQKIAERHHGRITATGEKNIGATITVILPCTQSNT